MIIKWIILILFILGIIASLLLLSRTKRKIVLTNNKHYGEWK
jgi:cell division septal protein FtsQ